MFKKLVIGIGISVVISVFVFYGVLTFYPRPDIVADMAPAAAAECMNGWAKNIFFITLPIGILIFYLGMKVITLRTLRGAFIGGGMLTVIIGAAHCWAGVPAYVKFIILAAVLCVLVWFGYNKLGEKPRKSHS